MKKRFAAGFVILCLLVVLVPSAAFAAPGDPDIGCYEYGGTATPINNAHPTYPSGNFGENGPDYYVATTGSDTQGDGTQDNPWRTLAHAAANVTANGAVINMAAGSYDESVKTILAPGVSIKGAGDGSSSGEAVTTIFTTTIPRLLPGSETWFVPNAIIELASSTNTNGRQHISGIRFVGDFEDAYDYQTQGADNSAANAGAALEIRNRNNVRVSDCTFEDFALSAVGWRSTQVAARDGAGTYVTGGSFNNNIVNNCAGKNQTQGYYFGALFCGGLEGFYIYANRMVEGQRDTGKQYQGGQAENGVPIKFWYYDGWIVNSKIYSNYLEKSWIPRHPTDGVGWPFAIEATNEAGLEIYDNTIIGTVDTNFGTKNVNGRSYAYSIYIHDNLIGPTSYTVTKPYDGICLEGWVNGVIIERNTIRNCCPAIWAHSTGDGNITDLTIRYNLCTGIRTERDDWYQDGIAFASARPNVHTISNLHIYNNTLIGVVSSFGDQPANAIELEIGSSEGSTYYGENIVIANNIISGFGDWWLNDMPVIDAAGYRSLDLSVTNNLFYNNGTLSGHGSTSPIISATPGSGFAASSYEHTGDIISAPLFVSSSNFHLSASSPAIDAGKGVAGGTVRDLDGKQVAHTAVTYGVSLNPNGISFDGAMAGYTAQPPRTVTVTNTGTAATGALNVALSGANAGSFTLSKTSISSIAAGGNGSFTIAPRTGLNAGTYTATVTVSGGNGISKSISVSFTVNANVSVGGIAIDPSESINFGTVSVDYTAQTPRALTVTNTGDAATGALSVALSGASAGGFTLSRTSISSITVGGRDSFTVVPKTGLAAGTYSATVTVSGNGIRASVTLGFTVRGNDDDGGDIGEGDIDDGNDDIVIYGFTEGANGGRTIGGADGLSFVCEGAYDKFISLVVDGAAVGQGNYTAKSGSTVLVLSPEYLDTLSIGAHTLRLNYTDGYGETSFSVNEPDDKPDDKPDDEPDDKPDDGGEPRADNLIKTVLWIALALLVVGGGVFAGLVLTRRKD